MQFLRTIAAYIASFLRTFVVAPLLRRLQPSVDVLVADCIRLDRRLDAFLDRETARRDAITAQRKAIRKQIDVLNDKLVASVDASDRAGRIQRRLKEIIE